MTIEKLRFAKTLRRSMTSAERRPWMALRRSQIDGLHFRRQQVIGKYVVDFYCDEARLAIELDGEPHNLRADYDLDRDAALAQFGVAMIRISNNGMRQEPETVAAWIAERARERIRELGNLTPGPFPKGKGSTIPGGLQDPLQVQRSRYGRQHLPRISPL